MLTTIGILVVLYGAYWIYDHVTKVKAEIKSVVEKVEDKFK